MNKEQASFNFDQPPVESVKTPELNEKDECSACGNIIESDSPGCRQCQYNKDKIAYQEKHKKEQA